MLTVASPLYLSRPSFNSQQRPPVLPLVATPRSFSPFIMSSEGGGPDGLNMVHETQIEAAVHEVRRISDLESSPHMPWEQRLQIARAAIATFDATGLAHMPNRIIDRIFVTAALQRIAYHDAEGSRVDDIADWCMDQWLSLLQRNAEDLNVLRGALCSLFIYRSTTYIMNRAGAGLVSPISICTCENTSS